LEYCYVEEIKNSDLEYPSDEEEYDDDEEEYDKLLIVANNYLKTYSDGESTRDGTGKYIPDNVGFCIRTRKQIPLDIEKPYSLSAYKKWYKESGDDNEPENYCHWSGEKSKGETSKARPILMNNLKDIISSSRLLEWANRDFKN
jgi:hypothetical protein